MPHGARPPGRLWWDRKSRAWFSSLGGAGGVAYLTQEGSSSFKLKEKSHVDVPKINCPGESEEFLSNDLGWQRQVSKGRRRALKVKV